MSRIVEALNRLCENNLSYNLPLEIENFIKMDSSIDYADQYRITKSAVDMFFKELKNIENKENDWDYIDSIYTEKKDFYKKYIDFAKKCKEMSSIKGITGYGSNDFLRTKIMEMCRNIDYNFPYGWKR